MCRIYLSIATAFLLFSFPTGRSSVQSAEQDGTDEEYKVYSALLKARYSADKPKTLVVVKMTSPNELILPDTDDQNDILKKPGSLTKEILNDYNTRNHSQLELRDIFDLKAKVLLVDEKEIHDIFRQQGVDGWKSFYQRFPDSGGFIKFSRVGFDAKRNLALIFVSHHCGGRCASGTYIILEKESNEWKIKEEHLVWIS